MIDKCELSGHVCAVVYFLFTGFFRGLFSMCLIQLFTKNAVIVTVHIFSISGTCDWPNLIIIILFILCLYFEFSLFSRPAGRTRIRQGFRSEAILFVLNIYIGSWFRRAAGVIAGNDDSNQRTERLRWKCTAVMSRVKRLYNRERQKDK